MTALAGTAGSPWLDGPTAQLTQLCPRDMIPETGSSAENGRLGEGDLSGETVSRAPRWA